MESELQASAGRVSHSAWEAGALAQESHVSCLKLLGNRAVSCLKLLGNRAVRGCEGTAGTAGTSAVAACPRRRAELGPRKAPPRVHEVEAEAGTEGQRGKCGLTFSPGWPFTPWGSHMQHGAQAREGGREKRKDEREAHTQEPMLMAQRPNKRDRCETRNKTKQMLTHDRSRVQQAQRVDSYCLTPWSVPGQPAVPDN